MSDVVIVITSISWNGEHDVNTIHKVVPDSQKQAAIDYVAAMNQKATAYSTTYDWEEVVMDSLPEVETFFVRDDKWGNHSLVDIKGKVVLSVLKGEFSVQVFKIAVKAYREELSASNRDHVLINERNGDNADEY